MTIIVIGGKSVKAYMAVGAHVVLQRGEFNNANACGRFLLPILIQNV